MANYSSIQELLTAICDAVRIRENSLGLIKHITIPDRIRNFKKQSSNTCKFYITSNTKELYDDTAQTITIYTDNKLNYQYFNSTNINCNCNFSIRGSYYNSFTLYFTKENLQAMPAGSTLDISLNYNAYTYNNGKSNTLHIPIKKFTFTNYIENFNRDNNPSSFSLASSSINFYLQYLHGIYNGSTSYYFIDDDTWAIYSSGTYMKLFHKITPLSLRTMKHYHFYSSSYAKTFTINGVTYNSCYKFSIQDGDTYDNSSVIIEFIQLGNNIFIYIRKYTLDIDLEFFAIDRKFTINKDSSKHICFYSRGYYNHEYIVTREPFDETLIDNNSYYNDITELTLNEVLNNNRYFYNAIGSSTSVYSYNSFPFFANQISSLYMFPLTTYYEGNVNENYKYWGYWGMRVYGNLYGKYWAYYNTSSNIITDISSNRGNIVTKYEIFRREDSLYTYITEIKMIRLVNNDFIIKVGKFVNPIDESVDYITFNFPLCNNSFRLQEDTQYNFYAANYKVTDYIMDIGEYDLNKKPPLSLTSQPFSLNNITGTYSTDYMNINTGGNTITPSSFNFMGFKINSIFYNANVSESYYLTLYPADLETGKSKSSFYMYFLKGTEFMTNYPICLYYSTYVDDFGSQIFKVKYVYPSVEFEVVFFDNKHDMILRCDIKDNTEECYIIFAGGTIKDQNFIFNNDIQQYCIYRRSYDGKTYITTTNEDYNINLHEDY